MFAVLQVLLYAVVTGGALVVGAVLGCFRTPPRQLTGGMLAFAAGALVVAVAFELFEPALVAAVTLDGVPEKLALGVGWGLTAALLAVALVAGRLAADVASEQWLGMLAAFAAGAMLASLADSVMPEAYAEGGLARRLRHERRLPRRLRAHDARLIVR